MNRISFSVVIPLYNKEKSILSTIRSALNQTYDDFEIVVVNDGSKDNSLSVVKSIQNDKIRIIDKPNGGVSSARNRGIMEARNNYIAFLDGDDLWAEDHLETLARMIEAYPDDVMFYTRYGSEEQIKKQNKDFQIIKTDDYISEYLRGNSASAITVCFCREAVIKEKFFFNENLTHGEDTDYWCRVSLKFGAVHCQRRTAIYREDAENRSVGYVQRDLSKRYGYIINYRDFSQNKTMRKYYYVMVRGLLITLFAQREYGLMLKLIRKQGFINCMIGVGSLIKEKFLR